MFVSSLHQPQNTLQVPSKPLGYLVIKNRKLYGFLYDFHNPPPLILAHRAALFNQNPVADAAGIFRIMDHAFSMLTHEFPIQFMGNKALGLYDSTFVHLGADNKSNPFLFI